MKVVIDTNVFWVSVTRKSKSNWLFQALIDGKFTLCLTTDILAEYEELISRRIGPSLANNVLELLGLLPNVEYVTRFFKWELVLNDPDDNKFVDCYVASQSEYLITHDRHFNVLKSLEFPPITVISLNEFREIISSR